MSKIVEESLERITKSLDNLPSDTKEMVKQLRIIVKGIGKLKFEDLRKVTTEVETEAKKLSEIKRSSRAKIDKLFEDYKEEVEETGKSIGLLGTLAKDTGRQFGNFGKSLTKVDGSFRGFADSLSNLPAIGGIFAGFSVVAGVIDSTIDAYRTVTQAGIQFENSILGLVQSSGELGLSLYDTTTMYKKYNNTIQRIGTPAFTGFIKEVRSNSSDLYALGFTYKDIVESSAQFLETQRNLTGLRTLNQQEQSKLFDQTIKEFYNAAQITGVGVEQLLKSLNDLSEDPKTRLILNSLPEAGQRMVASIREIDPKLAETVLEAIQKGAVERVDNYEDLVTSGTVDLVQGIVDMARDGSATTANFRDFLKSHEEELALRVGELGVAGIDGGLNFAAGILKTINEMVIDPKQDISGLEIDKLGELLLKLGPQINETVARIREILLNFTDDILGTDGAFGEIIASGLTNFIKMVTNPDNIAALTSFIDGIFRFTRVINGFVSSVQGMFGSTSPFLNVILTGIGGLMAANTALWLAKAAALNLFGAIFGSLGNAVGLGVRRSPLSRLMRGGAAIGALAAGGALIYNQMYSDSAATPSPATPDENEFDQNVMRERESLTASGNIIDIPPEVQAIVDKMNEETRSIIDKELDKQKDMSFSSMDQAPVELSVVQPPLTAAASTPIDPEAEYTEEQRKLAIQQILSTGIKEYFEKNNARDQNPPNPAEIEPSTTSPGFGETVGTPPITPETSIPPGADATLLHEKRMLELAEENAMLTKVLAGASMAVAEKTIDTQRVLTSNIV